MNHKIIDVALAVIKDKQGRYLVAQRPASTDYADFWEFPGGKREACEDRLQVLKRECAEELGIKVERARPLFCWEYEYKVNAEGREGALGCKVNAEGREGALGCKVNAEGRHECRKPVGVSVEGALGYNDRCVRLDAWLIDGYSGEAHGAEGQQVRWLYPDEFKDYTFLEANKVLMKVLALPECCVITPDVEIDSMFYSKIESLKSSDYTLLQFRAKNLSDAEYKKQALELAKFAAERGMTIMLNAGQECVEAIEGVGLHLTSRRLLGLSSRPIVEGRWLSASCHNSEELAHAERIGVDFVFLSPVLETPSHPGAEILGWEKLESLVAKANIPVYALGGMKKANVSQAQQVGCQGIAGISEFWD
ncbi:MAG: Nudix family hydrolase [Gammaproteobacteria bacterium]|nr:Nudix family hydrolase [Gammaproteobacteria bacterium]